MPAQTRSKNRAAYAALVKKSLPPKFDWAKIDAAAEAAAARKKSRKSRGGQRSRKKTRKLRHKV